MLPYQEDWADNTTVTGMSDLMVPTKPLNTGDQVDLKKDQNPVNGEFSPGHWLAIILPALHRPVPRRTPFTACLPIAHCHGAPAQVVLICCTFMNGIGGKDGVETDLYLSPECHSLA